MHTTFVKFNLSAFAFIYQEMIRTPFGHAKHCLTCGTKQTSDVFPVVQCSKNCLGSQNGLGWFLPEGYKWDDPIICGTKAYQSHFFPKLIKSPHFAFDEITYKTYYIFLMRSSILIRNVYTLAVGYQFFLRILIFLHLLGVN